MKYLTAICAITALSACQSGALPILSKATPASAAKTGLMRPSGTAFENAATRKVTDFETCVGIGIIVPGSAPIQCVHEGVTYTGS